MTSGEHGTGAAKSRISCARARVLLEPYLDGALGVARLKQLESHLGTCPDCRVELDAARRIQEGLHALPRWKCPDGLLGEVLAQVDAEAPRDAWSRLAARVGAWTVRPLWRPALSAIAVAAMAIAIALLARQPDYNGYDARDVVRAEREARWALAYAAELTRRASGTAMQSVIGEVMGEVIGERVVFPVTDAVRQQLEEKKP